MRNRKKAEERRFEDAAMGAIHPAMSTPSAKFPDQNMHVHNAMPINRIQKETKVSATFGPSTASLGSSAHVPGADFKPEGNSIHALQNNVKRNVLKLKPTKRAEKHQPSMLQANLASVELLPQDLDTRKPAKETNQRKPEEIKKLYTNYTQTYQNVSETVTLPLALQDFSTNVPGDDDKLEVISIQEQQCNVKRKALKLKPTKKKAEKHQLSVSPGSLEQTNKSKSMKVQEDAPAKDSLLSEPLAKMFDARELASVPTKMLVPEEIVKNCVNDTHTYPKRIRKPSIKINMEKTLLSPVEKCAIKKSKKSVVLQALSHNVSNALVTGSLENEVPLSNQVLKGKRKGNCGGKQKERKIKIIKTGKKIKKSSNTLVLDEQLTTPTVVEDLCAPAVVIKNAKKRKKPAPDPIRLPSEHAPVVPLTAAKKKKELMTKYKNLQVPILGEENAQEVTNSAAQKINIQNMIDSYPVQEHQNVEEIHPPRPKKRKKVIVKEEPLIIPVPKEAAEHEVNPDTRESNKKTVKINKKNATAVIKKVKKKKWQNPNPPTILKIKVKTMGNQSTEMNGPQVLPEVPVISEALTIPESSLETTSMQCVIRDPPKRGRPRKEKEASKKVVKAKTKINPLKTTVKPRKTKRQHQNKVIIKLPNQNIIQQKEDQEKGSVIFEKPATPSTSPKKITKSNTTSMETVSSVGLEKKTDGRTVSISHNLCSKILNRFSPVPTVVLHRLRNGDYHSTVKSYSDQSLTTSTSSSTVSTSTSSRAPSTRNAPKSDDYADIIRSLGLELSSSSSAVSLAYSPEKIIAKIFMNFDKMEWHEYLKNWNNEKPPNQSCHKSSSSNLTKTPNIEMPATKVNLKLSNTFSELPIEKMFSDSSEVLENTANQGLYKSSQVLNCIPNKSNELNLSGQHFCLPKKDGTTVDVPKKSIYPQIVKTSTVVGTDLINFNNDTPSSVTFSTIVKNSTSISTSTVVNEKCGNKFNSTTKKMLGPTMLANSKMGTRIPHSTSETTTTRTAESESHKTCSRDTVPLHNSQNTVCNADEPDYDTISIYADSIEDIEKNSSCLQNSEDFKKPIRPLTPELPKKLQKNKKIVLEKNDLTDKLLASSKVVCEKQNADSTSLLNAKSGSNTDETMSEGTKSADYFNCENEPLPEDMPPATHPNNVGTFNQPVKLMFANRKSQLFQVCHFNLNSDCKFRNNCKHYHISLSDHLLKIRRASIIHVGTFSSEYIYMRSKFFRKPCFELYLDEFIQICVKQSWMKFLFELMMDGINALKNPQNVLEKALISINNFTMDKFMECIDILGYKMPRNGQLLIHALLKVISNSQDIIKLVPVLSKLLTILHENNEKVELETAMSLVDKVCSLPFDEALLHSVYHLIIRNTNKAIYGKIHPMEHFRELISNVAKDNVKFRPLWRELDVSMKKFAQENPLSVQSSETERHTADQDTVDNGGNTASTHVEQSLIMGRIQHAASLTGQFDERYNTSPDTTQYTDFGNAQDQPRMYQIPVNFGPRRSESPVRARCRGARPARFNHHATQLRLRSVSPWRQDMGPRPPGPGQYPYRF